MSESYYAHIRQSDGVKEPVVDHLDLVSKLCAFYMKPYGLEKLGSIIGYVHDGAKLTDLFQKILNRMTTKVNHAIGGAAVFVKYFEYYIEDNCFLDLAFRLAVCHHSGLGGDLGDKFFGYPFGIDRVFDDSECVLKDFDCEFDGKVNALSSEKEIEGIVDVFKKRNFEVETASFPSFSESASAIETMAFVRLLFSCLVDADYTATQAFEWNEKVAFDSMDLSVFLDIFDRFYENCFGSLVMAESKDTLNSLRRDVYKDASAAGCAAVPGMYTMTAPTGTGKTLAMLKFALESAVRNGQKRIFIVLPYLSIIKQNFEVYRKIFASFPDDVVMEDDSTVSSKDREGLTIEFERWGLPIVVTTNVKFCETMFAKKSSVLRKLHQITDSVIVFDEAQTLPVDLLGVTLHNLNFLTRYNTTVLFSSATMPSYKIREDLRDIRWTEIMSDTQGLYARYHKLHRVSVDLLQDDVDFDMLTDMVGSAGNQGLIMFNTKKKALMMYETMCSVFGSENCFLLSSDFCPSHKQAVLQAVLNRLAQNQPCYLSSTQCIEAGVDVDFPFVYTELSPMSSLIQRNGRCNRECNHIGRLVIFSLKDGLVSGIGYPSYSYKMQSEDTGYIFKGYLKNHDELNLDDLSLMNRYWLYHYKNAGTQDKLSIREAVDRFSFNGIADSYHLIDNASQVMVIVPYSGEKDLYDAVYTELTENGFVLSRKMQRMAKPVTVSTYPGKWLSDGLIPGCQRLYAWKGGEKIALSWYLMMENDGYTDERGYGPVDKKGGIFID